MNQKVIIFNVPCIQIELVILYNIEMLKLDPNAFSFNKPTNLILLEVGGLQGWEGPNNQPFKKNIHNLAIVNSTMLQLDPNLFSKKLKPNHFHLEGSVFSIADLEDGHLFNFDQQLKRLKIKRCNVTSTSKNTFIKATATSVEV